MSNWKRNEKRNNKEIYESGIDRMGSLPKIQNVVKTHHEDHTRNRDDSLGFPMNNNGIEDDFNGWRRIDGHNEEKKFERFPFTGKPGLNVDVDHDPLAYLRLFIDDTIIERIITETNRYADQSGANGDIPMHFRAITWEPLTSNELWLFFGLMILQGMVNKPVQNWYWSTNKLIETPFFGNVMSERRFSLIMKFLHFADNEEGGSGDHIAPKLRKFL
jgi:Transposase IS4